MLILLNYIFIEIVFKIIILARIYLYVFNYENNSFGIDKLDVENVGYTIILRISSISDIYNDHY